MTMPFKSILVGFETPEHGHDALALGELLARAGRAQLTAAGVYVFHPIHREGDAEFEAIVREEAGERIALAAELAHDPKPSLAVVRGHSRAEGLHRYAVETEADLIVVGSTHHGAMGRVMTRGMPETLLHDAPCAVAVAPRGYAARHPDRLATIGVGFDDGDESRAALETAASLARATGARLQVIAVLDPAIGDLTPRVLAELEYLEYEVSVRRQLERALAEAVAELDDVDAAAVTCDGPVVGELTTRSHELDLLMLGSRCYGAVRRVLLGSVSTKVLRQAGCPVLVVPRTAAEPQPSTSATSSAEARA
jgi:nucleotide-binding universal stress UspA family protein